MSRLLPLAVPLILLIALGVRAISAASVFGEHGILPGTLTDEPYHLRRIWYSVVHFPKVLSFDPYVNFPDGGWIHWPPGFDWMVAALARLLVGAEDRTAVETLAVWMPAVLGMLTVAATMGVAGAALGRAAALTSGAILAVLPASWTFSQLGLVDHHVAVALSGMALLGASMAWLRRNEQSLAPALDLGLGLAMALPLLIWPGFLLHLGIAQVGLVVATLGAATRPRAVARARHLAACHALAGLGVLPFCLGPELPQYGAWSPLVLSRFQPAWLLGGAIALGVVAVLWQRVPAGRERSARVAIAAGIGTLGVGVALAAAPGLREALLYASGWFTQADEARTVSELQPQTFASAVLGYTWLVFLFPVAWVVVARCALETRRADLAMLLLWSAAFLGLSLLQRRFNNSFGAPYALVWGSALALAAPALRRRLAGRPLRLAGAGLAGIAAAGVVALPLMAYYEGPVRKARAIRTHGNRSALSALPPYQRVHVGAARWMRRSTPPTQGYLDPSLRPEYGVLTSWGTGHLVRHFSERPLVQDNFGVYGGRENFERAWAYYAAPDEETAIVLLDRLRVRYVLATRHGAGMELDSYAPGTMTHRLAVLHGSAGEAEDPETGAALRIPALAHHRLVYHARSAPGAGLRAEKPQVDVAVYERVAGARVEGRAEPGAEIEARLRLTTGGGLRLLPRASGAHVHRAVTRADETGRYRLTLPYSTDVPFSDAVRPLGAWELRAGEARRALEVPEAAVREGARIAGPDLVAAQAAPSHGPLARTQAVAPREP